MAAELGVKKACCGPGPPWQDGGERDRKNEMQQTHQGYQNQIIQIHCLDLSLGRFMGGLGSKDENNVWPVSPPPWGRGGKSFLYQRGYNISLKFVENTIAIHLTF